MTQLLSNQKLTQQITSMKPILAIYNDSHKEKREGGGEVGGGGKGEDRYRKREEGKKEGKGKKEEKGRLYMKIQKYKCKHFY